MSTFAPHTLNDGAVVPGIAYGVGTACSVGVAIKESGVSRDSIFVTTKAGPGLKDPKAAFKRSLEKLQLQHIDLFLLHWPYDFVKPGYPSIEAAWKALEELKDEGLAKSIGVSNFRVRDLQKILDSNPKYKPAVNQIEFHPFMYEAGEELYQFMKKHDIALEAYGPTSPVTKFSGGEFDKVLEKVTEAVSSRAGTKAEPSQVLLKLAAQRGAVVITTSGKAWRMKEQLAAGQLPDLSQEEIDSLTKSAKPAPQRAFMKHMDDKDTEY
ncbi:hypothetical protein JCM5296_003326 [Sporobolomyces johnsonii]